MSRTLRRYDAGQIRRLAEMTIAYYDRFAQDFWDGTRHHDVSQNYAAFLDAIEGDPPFRSLTSVADPAAISGTSDPWGIKPWGSTDRCNSPLSRVRNRNARSCIRIFWRYNCPKAAL